MHKRSRGEVTSDGRIQPCLLLHDARTYHCDQDRTGKAPAGSMRAQTQDAPSDHGGSQVHKLSGDGRELLRSTSVCVCVCVCAHACVVGGIHKRRDTGMLIWT